MGPNTINNIIFIYIYIYVISRLSIIRYAFFTQTLSEFKTEPTNTFRPRNFHTAPRLQAIIKVGRLLKDHFEAAGSLEVQPDQGLSICDNESDSSDSGLEGLAF